MANLNVLAAEFIEPLREASVDQLLRLGAFCLLRNGKEKTIKAERRKPAFINPAVEGSEYSGITEPMAGEDYDSLVVDGFPGSAERIENLAQYYAIPGNNSVEDRRGNELSVGKSPSVLKDSEESDRLIATAVGWKGEQTPFIRAIRELIAAELGS